MSDAAPFVLLFIAVVAILAQAVRDRIGNDRMRRELEEERRVSATRDSVLNVLHEAVSGVHRRVIEPPPLPTLDLTMVDAKPPWVGKRLTVRLPRFPLPGEKEVDNG